MGDPAKHLLALAHGQLPALDTLGQEAIDGRHSFGRTLLIDFTNNGVVASRGRHLSNTRAHEAATHDADFVYLSHARLSPTYQNKLSANAASNAPPLSYATSSQVPNRAGTHDWGHSSLAP